MILKTDPLPYQKEAFDKLKRIRVGALYMEMGTGKTRTALELIKHRMDQGKIDHVIWLCPCSIKDDIQAGIFEHSDLVPGKLLTICGIETMSTSVREISRMLGIAKKRKVYLIVDESSKIKNHAALRSMHIAQIADLCSYKLILSGTPITRSVVDLYSQWYILDWRILGYRSYWSFAANHIEFDKNRPGKVVRALNIDYLTSKIAPYTYQVKKEDVLILPQKYSNVRTFSLTREQYDHYDEIADRLLFEIDEMRPETIYRLFGALQSIVSGYAIKINANMQIERHPFFAKPHDNPRIQALIDTVGTLGDEKAIIFCNYVDEINLIVNLLPKAVAFSGETPQNNRQETIDKFRGGAQYLVSSKGCGAFGLNLQHCHNVIYYSHDWDWGTRAQSEDRVHRIGQTHDVKIFDICAHNTIDMRILSCLSKKESISAAFKRRLKPGGSNDGIKKYINSGV